MISRDYRPTLGELPDSARTAVREAMDQMLLVLVERAGGEVEIAVQELDSVPVGKVLEMEIVGDRLLLQIRRKA